MRQRQTPENKGVRTELARKYLNEGLTPRQVQERMLREGHDVVMQFVYTISARERKKKREALKAKRASKAQQAVPANQLISANTQATIKSVRQVLSIEALNEDEQLRIIRKIVG